MDRNVRGSTERLRSPVRSRREDSKPEAAPKVRPPPSPPIMSAVAPKVCSHREESKHDVTP
eukprot:880190-Prorocentrum_minimum.AAC.1